jgi:high affinity Mn2+ porin
MPHLNWSVSCCVAPFVLALATDAHAEGEGVDTTQAKFQATYIWQAKPGFGAAYSGPHSLSTDRERSYSYTATAALGIRAWHGAELYFDPELAAGLPLSNLTGLGGFTNGEIARTSGRNPTVYRARLFLRQTWGLGGGTEHVDADHNQMAGIVDKRRLVATVGNFSALDVFDDNAYSHDPRTQFLNWSLMTHGAYDYAADARGYSWGAALEYLDDAWALRAARFIEPRESNGLRLDPRIMRHHGDQLEIEHAHSFSAQPGKVRLLAYRNRAMMGSFREALAEASLTGSAPDLALTRTHERVKYGFGINLEQALSDDIGVFARTSWNNGQTETFAFTEIDRSISTGLAVKGTAWRRPQDRVGVALARNGLSSAHRDYLAAGGLGFFLGDGRLTYKPETIGEAYYNFNIASHAWLSIDYQRIHHPGYNADRGPVAFASLRLHTEF